MLVLGSRVVGGDGSMVGAAVPRASTARCPGIPIAWPHNSIPDSHRDLLEGQVLTLATVGEDGYPQLSEVWFLVEDGQVAMSLNTRRQKVKNLLTEPSCTVLLLDLQNPYRYLEVRGTAVVTPDDDRAFAGASAPSTTPTCVSTTRPGTAGWWCGSSLSGANAVDMSG